MQILINQKSIETDCHTLSDLVVAQNLPQQGIAIAVNRRMISRQEWDKFKLEAGMDIIIIKAVCGG